MKKALFVVLLTVVPVLAFLALAEVVLRAAGTGYPTGPLLRVKQNEKDYWVGNPDFTRLFFPAALKRLPPANRIPVRKEPSSRRYMVVGGSAAAGDPDTDFSVARNLQWILSHLHPAIDWQVLNLAYTACNSHVAAEVVRQSGPYDLDGIVVLVGNNEVIGPFGPGTNLTANLPSSFTRGLQLAVRKTALGQFGQNLREALRSGGEHAETWRGMRHFLEHRIQWQDPRLEQVYSNFSDNLHAIQKEARRRDIPVLLSTVPVNLLDQPPFYDDRGALPEELRERLLPVLRGGDGGPTPAELAAAAERYPDCATVQFAAGRRLWQEDDPERAAAFLERARDLDQLRFRADSRINGIIREFWKDAEATWLPMEAEIPLREDHPANALGFPHFYEHVHFSFRANFLLAREMARRLLRKEGLSAEGLDELQWTGAAAGLAYTSFEAWRILGEIEQRFSEAPFTGIPAYDQLTAWMDSLRNGLQQRIAKAEEKARLQGIYEAALRARPHDDRIRLNYAQFLTAFQRKQAAFSLMQGMSGRHPTDSETLITWLNLCLGLEKPAPAREALARIEAIFPEHPNLPRFRQQVAALAN